MATDRWVGQTIGGRYKIEELLGQGGMSSVYKALDPNLQRTVAIKLIHPHLSNNEEFVRRFESEATAIARLRHPNIVQVYDFNHDGDLYFMVLEFVAGETLQERIKRINQAGRHLPIRDVLHFIIDVCKAADYAHQRGLIHRDIKPANVMLDVSGNAILMDFGIARILGGQQHTATGAVLGTALYMSPEQIQGLHPDARSDIYSLGVTLFEALGGRPPFEADSVMTLMMMHLNDPVPDLNDLNPDIPETVKAIVNHSLEKDRNNRFQSCAEMAAALQKVLDSLGEPAPKPAPQPAKAPPIVKEAVQPAPHPAAEPAPANATIIEPPAPAESSATIIERRPAPTAPPPQTAATAVTPAVQVEQPPISAPAPKKKNRFIPHFEGFQGNKAILWIGLLALLITLYGGRNLIIGLVSPQKTPTPTAAIAQIATIPFTPEEVLPTSTATTAPIPTNTTAPIFTDTPAIVDTPTTAAPTVPTLGGADQIAFIAANNIYTANIDGSQVKQITSDGTVKKYLRWLPDGQGFTYISGKCIQTADLAGTIGTITCFNYAEYLDAFEVSPDGKQAAVSVDRLLYLVPFDLERLAQTNSHSDLTNMAGCKELAPYQRNAGIAARWSKDSKTLAVIALGVLDDGRRGDIAQVIAVDRCISNPAVQVQFPQPHFTFGEYNRTPTLTGFTWDGGALFAMTGFSRNEGFGELHLFNRETYKAQTNINPISGKCCYRDPQFSPDGQYLLFAFQDETLGAASVTQVYYVPYGTIGTGAQYTALPLPENTNPKEDPQLILRPAQP